MGQDTDREDRVRRLLERDKAFNRLIDDAAIEIADIRRDLEANALTPAKPASPKKEGGAPETDAPPTFKKAV